MEGGVRFCDKINILVAVCGIFSYPSSKWMHKQVLIKQYVSIEMQI
jgi:hypothetical protein